MKLEFLADLEQVYFRFVMESFEDGIMTIAVDDIDRRISVDLSYTPINTIIYYVDGIPNEMVRLDPRIDPGRYRFEELENDGILLTYIADYQSFWSAAEYAHIYRSTVQGYDGERIFTHRIVDENDRIFFEFADLTAEPSIVYFYTIKGKTSWHNYTITFGGETQIRAYIDAVAGDFFSGNLPPYGFGMTEYGAGSQSNTIRNVVVIMASVVLAIVIAVFIIRRKNKEVK